MDSYLYNENKINTNNYIILIIKGWNYWKNKKRELMAGMY